MLRLLAAWADTRAMLGHVNQQGSYHRKWTLAGAALAYLQIRDSPGLDATAMGRVADWLRAVALAVKPPYDRDPQPGKMSIAQNNHAYWAGLGVGAAAIAVNDRALFAWAIERLRIGLRQVTAEGALPLELARGRLALHYHLFALEPLAVLEIMARTNGADLAPAHDAALRRLVVFTLRALDNPGEIAGLARAEQQDDWLKGRSPLTGARASRDLARPTSRCSRGCQNRAVPSLSAALARRRRVAALRSLREAGSKSTTASAGSAHHGEVEATFALLKR